MDRHVFFDACEWLQPMEEHQLNAAAPQAETPAATAFAGAASLHLSPAEQQGCVTEFRGPLAPDAVHLAFAAASGTAHLADPMQLRLRVGVSLPAHPPLPQQHLRVTLLLDGRPYRLLLAQAARLVLPEQLARRLPAALQQEVQRGVPGSGHQQWQEGAASGAASVPASVPAAVPAAAAAASAPPPFLCAAPHSQLPFLTLVFPHACLNIYPLGWKAAAAHVSQDHDASELARLAQLLAECWQQQRLLAVGSQASAADQAALPASGSWQQELQAWQAAVQALVAAAGDLASGGAAGAESSGVASAQLAAAAGGMLRQGRAAAAALPGEQQALSEAEAQLAAAVAQGAGGSQDGVLQQLACLNRQHASLAACCHLATC